MNLCDKCSELYQKWKSNWFAGSRAVRPIFCPECEREYWEGALEGIKESKD